MAAELDGRAIARRADDSDSPVEALDNALRNRQAKADATALRCMERLERQAVVRTHARPIVLDTEAEMPLSPIHCAFDDDPAVALNCLHRVRDDAVDNLVDEQRIRAQREASQRESQCCR